ncbi:hypothetical protein AVEN_113855-1 [Araneus ventricosus]|uniref:Uncharacterized protein n=1 Tax=Araneus ventricosus TaxID=182803 RepID=A0A4Y2MYG1_ARAVE|nr:hypothetical protein AVEN_113855-1 [Araneus ventricosus]
MTYKKILRKIQKFILTCDRLAGRRLYFLNKAPEGGLKASALSGREHGLYLEESICGSPCLMLVDTGGNLTFSATFNLVLVFIIHNHPTSNTNVTKLVLWVYGGNSRTSRIIENDSLFRNNP